MACSNFCSTEDLGQLNYSLGYVSRADERAEYQRIQKAEAQHEAKVAASQIELTPGPATIAAHIHQGDPVVTAMLAAGVLLGAGPLQAVAEAISAAIGQHRAHRM